MPRDLYSDGTNFVDIRNTITNADESTVTLSTTMKALWADQRTKIHPASLTAGKIWRLTAFGKATTDATAGNYVFEVALGTGDAPAALAASPTAAGSTSQTDIAWMAQAFMEVRVGGASGKVRLWGVWTPSQTLVSGGNGNAGLVFPSTPADITVDLTTGKSLTFQLQRSGAGVWTATTTSVVLESLN